MSSGPELHERQLRILRLLRECTARGLITWQPGEDDPDHYRTTSGPWAGYIQFKWVAFHGESGSDRDFVEVGHAGHHMAGTPGWWLTLEILAAGDVAYWRNHNQQLAASYDSTIAKLSAVLGESQRHEATSGGAP